ncbi:MAG: hypothetical protein ABL958_21935 [Bdellovibrionia bacterium]
MKAVLIAVFPALMVTQVSFAGIHTVYDHKNISPTPESCVMNSYVDLAFIRADFQCGDKNNFSLIWDTKAEQTTNIDHKGKQYMTITLKDSKAMAQAMAPQMEKMKKVQEQLAAQLKNMPPDQRKMMEKALGGQQQQMIANGPRTIKKTGTSTVGSYKCDLYDTFVGGQKTGESCIADWSQTKVDHKKYLAVVTTWQKHIEDMTKSMSNISATRDWGDWAKGFMVKHSQYNQGKVVSQMTIKSIADKSLSSDLGKPPADYKKGPSPVEMMKAQAAKNK